VVDVDPAWINAGKGTTVGTATISAATDLLTIAAHGLTDGAAVVVDTLTGGATSALKATPVVYFVRDATINTFALAAAPGDTPVLFASDGGAAVYLVAAQYTAVELRRNDAVLLTGGVADRLGARPGVRPGVAPVSIAGTTVTVHDVPVVIYPGGTSTSGPYRGALLQTAFPLNAAEANPRLDIIYVQVQDHDEDSSNQRRLRPVYLAGAASGSPVAPTPPTGAFRLATITVPQSGGGSATLAFDGPYTVASGGILPVRTDAELPTEGRYEGMPAYHQGNDNLIVWSGSAWVAVGSAKSPTQQRFTANGTWNKPAGLKYAVVEAQGGGGAGGGAAVTNSSQSSAGSGGQGGAYARTIFAASALGSSEQVTVGAGGTPVSAGAGGAGNTSSFGSGGTLVSAAGGAGGGAVAASATTGYGHGADAAQSITGQIQIPGGGGAGGGRGGTQGCTGGTGGASFMGTGGGGKGGPSSAGAAGKGYGGAGGGATNVLDSGAKSGGAGAAGIVVVTEYYA
jgi:hypothetical protein